MRRTIWLASYPKSGNTWFRMLLANLGRETPVDINDLTGRGGIASARKWFDEVMLFPSGLLTHDECDRIRPRVYEAIARREEDRLDGASPGVASLGVASLDGAGPDGADPEDEGAWIGDVRFVKTHDAWTRSEDGQALLGGRGAAEGAILIVRDPRDVAPSLAGHNRQTIDDTIRFMSRDDAAFCDREDRQPNQLRQQLGDWSGYHRSWLVQTELPVHVVRYEDMKTDICEVLTRALAFAGRVVPAARIRQAARFADFAQLQMQERAHGFREGPRPRLGTTPSLFFRRGEVGGWRSDLTTGQTAAIEAMHGEVMARFGYAAGMQA